MLLLRPLVRCCALGMHRAQDQPRQEAPMSRHERLSAILGIIVDEGSVHIDDIIERLGVSAATARRDLDLLANQQLVTRTRVTGQTVWLRNWMADRKNIAPSREAPVRASTLCSGCGMSPTTLPCSLVIPAMSWADPFGLSR